jgi:hypothetical protein
VFLVFSKRNAGGLLPANYNANFKLHKKEWDQQRREETRQFLESQNRAAALAAGLPAPAPTASFKRETAPGKQIPGFLAGPEEQRREWVQRGDRDGFTQAAATDDRTVDRFVKRFKK